LQMQILNDMWQLEADKRLVGSLTNGSLKGEEWPGVVVRDRPLRRISTGSFGHRG
jgi:hypothetical protein